MPVIHRRGPAHQRPRHDSVGARHTLLRTLSVIRAFAPADQRQRWRLDPKILGALGGWLPGSAPNQAANRRMSLTNAVRAQLADRQIRVAASRRLPERHAASVLGEVKPGRHRKIAIDGIERTREILDEVSHWRPDSPGRCGGLPRACVTRARRLRGQRISTPGASTLSGMGA